MIDKKSPPSSYYSDRDEMLPFIPGNTKKALDIGCGEGGFGKILKEKLSLEIWGIERLKEPAQKASRVYDKVIIADMEKDGLDLPYDYFDCLIFNDVLEHFVDPWKVLLKLKPHLTEGGHVIASIPNVRYFDNIYNLLMKRDWQYTEHGILDITHLRFFTERSIKTLFLGCGYEVVEITGIGRKRSKRITRGLLNVISLNTLSDIKYLQFACIARKINE